MTTDRITAAMRKYWNKIPTENVFHLQYYLKEASDDCFEEFMSLRIKGLVRTVLFSVFLGDFAVDRFYIGDTGIGIAKLILRWLPILLSLFSGNSLIVILSLICTLAYIIWYIADIFISYKNAKKVNYEILSSFLIRHKETI